ncbi:unnamed protein product [Periconia digitata]|uniref:PinX1-related protein 1 n=1 Tax=Periconia digitata TaxID=1303443 RepID=A0A9W4XRK8_9PLEO|nr:unnamed protein product [Periconia digitata]
MGLAAPKNRSRISNDPQNTTWANNTNRFGHKILAAQGWTPGSSLGAANAAHAAHYTAASASHIRVLLKDDTLGLGAKRGSESAENFGLAGLASILGRLNGNEADVKKEEERREKVEQRAYVYRKYGLMNFVSGGFLVGGEIKAKNEIEVKKEVEVKQEIKSESEGDEPKSKKRKRSSGDTKGEKEETGENQPKLKRKKKSINLREGAGDDDDDEEDEDEAVNDSSSKSKKSKKDKKDKKDKKSRKSSSTDTPSSTDPASDKARRKAERRARKEKKKLKKALKKAAKEAAQSNPTSNDPSSSSSEDDDEEQSTPSSSTLTSGVSTPASGASGLNFGMNGRHAVRQRYIRQKKMAGMDPQALKEIFMIKTTS